MAQNVIPAISKLLTGMGLAPSSTELGGSEIRRAAKRYSGVETLADEFGKNFATALTLLKDDILSIEARYDTSAGKLQVGTKARQVLNPL
jgi:hypothetical protein